MTRDPLAEALARELDAQDQEAEPRWEEREHADGAGMTDEDLAAALFRPLDAQALGRIEARVQSLTAQGPTGAAGAPAQVVPIPKRRRTMAAAILAPLALAAGLILYMAVSPTSASLPTYQLDVHGGAQPLRHAASDATAARISLAPGSQVELIARPSTAVTGPVAVRAYFVRGDDVRPWNPTIEVSPDGAVRATAAPSSWSDLSPGAWDLVMLIGRPDDLPSDASGAKRLLAAPARESVHVLRQPVEVQR